jgi:hypothetical protein
MPTSDRAQTSNSWTERPMGLRISAPCPTDPKKQNTNSDRITIETAYTVTVNSLIESNKQTDRQTNDCG